MDLAISSIADYVFLKAGLLECERIEDKCYVVAKRCLTLLNSLMLFNGLCQKSYISRIDLAKKHFDRLKAVITNKDLLLLEALTQYKLSGDIRQLFSKFAIPTTDCQAMFSFLDSFFGRLAKVTLVYELQRLIQDEKVPMGSVTNELNDLAEMFVRIHQKSFVGRLLCILRLLPFVFELKRNKLEMVLYSILLGGIEVKTMLQYLMIRSFVSMDQVDISQRSNYLAQIKMMWNYFMS
jgi:hypothetical protein